MSKSAVTCEIQSYPIFLTMLESMMTLPTLPDVGRLAQFKMADFKLEVLCISGNGMTYHRNSSVAPAFSTMPESVMILPTLPDVGAKTVARLYEIQT
jgi:hypothetical protein